MSKRGFAVRAVGEIVLRVRDPEGNVVERVRYDPSVLAA